MIAGGVVLLWDGLRGGDLHERRDVVRDDRGEFHEAARTGDLVAIRKFLGRERNTRPNLNAPEIFAEAIDGSRHISEMLLGEEAAFPFVIRGHLLPAIPRQRSGPGAEVWGVFAECIEEHGDRHEHAVRCEEFVVPDAHRKEREQLSEVTMVGGVSLVRACDEFRQSMEILPVEA